MYRLVAVSLKAEGKRKLQVFLLFALQPACAKMTGKIARQITQLVHSIPLFPHHVDRLLAAALKPTEDSADILRLIRNEPQLWTKLSHLASSYYTADKEIKTADDALHCIGVQPLVQLIGVSYARKAIQEEFASLKYLNDYFDHGEDISIGCHILAQVTDMSRQQREMYAVAGLIHDVGRLAIMVATHRTSARVLGTLWDKMASVVHDEKADMGMNHCEVGVRICRKWKFSPVIQEAVSRHHTPLLNSDFSLPGALIFISHFLSGSDPSREIVSAVFPAVLLARLKLTRTAFNKAKKLYNSRARTAK